MMADEFVVQSAQVSSKGETEVAELIALYEAGKINVERFINALVKGKHGSPFEHNAITLFVEAPIFVFREWHRHRIASINEMSGRYTVLPGKFYIPDEDRNVINKGTKMKPDFSFAEEDVERFKIISDDVRTVLQLNNVTSWKSYEDMLANDVAPEVARMVLPVNIYSQMYWTVNARSLMNFLSLRSRQDGAAYVSYPQREIQMGAEQIEDIFAEIMPHTYRAFIKNGRVAP
jgi:thymidylate synthase (FAD)